MVYAKQMKDGEVVAVLVYNYTPEFPEGSSVMAITEEEYNSLRVELLSKPRRELSAVTGFPISDSEAIAAESKNKTDAEGEHINAG